MGEPISIAEFARREGVSHTLVHFAIRDGKLAKLPNGKMDSALVGSGWHMTKRPKRDAVSPEPESALISGTPGTQPKGVAYGEALRLKENWNALLRRLEYEQKSGSLIESSVAESVVFELCREQRDAWLAWPVKVAPVIAARFGIEDLDALAAMLSEHVHTQLSELGEPHPQFRNVET